MATSSCFEGMAVGSDECLLPYGAQPPGEKACDRRPESESDSLDPNAHSICMDDAKTLPVGLLNSRNTTTGGFEDPSWPDRSIEAPMSFSAASSRSYQTGIPTVTASWLRLDTAPVSTTWPLALHSEYSQAPADLTSLTHASASVSSVSTSNLNIPDSPRSMMSPYSSPSRSRTSVNSADMAPPKKKRGRPFKADLSTVTTRARPGRPPKNPPIDTTSLPSPATTDCRHPSTSTTASTSTSPADPADDRLVRNRRAATKCRAKAQAVAAQLEAEELAARTTNRKLSMLRLELHNEVLYLRHELLRHVNCDCPLINGYLAERARLISSQGHG